MKDLKTVQNLRHLGKLDTFNSFFFLLVFVFKASLVRCGVYNL